MDGGCDRHPGLDVAVLIQGLDETREVGDEGVVQLVDVPADAVDEMSEG